MLASKLSRLSISLLSLLRGFQRPRYKKLPSTVQLLRQCAIEAMHAMRIAGFCSPPLLRRRCKRLAIRSKTGPSRKEGGSVGYRHNGMSCTAFQLPGRCRLQATDSLALLFSHPVLLRIQNKSDANGPEMSMTVPKRAGARKSPNSFVDDAAHDAVMTRHHWLESGCIVAYVHEVRHFINSGGRVILLLRL